MNRFPNFSLKTKMDKMNWSNDFHLNTFFSLEFDNLFNNTDFERLKTGESDTVAKICNMTTGKSERTTLQAETTKAIKLSAPDESRFPPSLNKLIQETLKEEETKTTMESQQRGSEEVVVILDKAA